MLSLIATGLCSVVWRRCKRWDRTLFLFFSSCWSFVPASAILKCNFYYHCWISWHGNSEYAAKCLWHDSLVMSSPHCFCWSLRLLCVLNSKKLHLNCKTSFYFFTTTPFSCPALLLSLELKVKFRLKITFKSRTC